MARYQQPESERVFMDVQPDTLKTARVTAPQTPAPQTPAPQTPAPKPASRLALEWLQRGRDLRARYPRATTLGGALLIYLLLALAYFWWPIHGHFRDTAITSSLNSTLPDFGQSLWYLRWWPYALTHGLNPFITTKLWHTYGYNTTWQIAIPAVALLMWPVTAAAGAVAAFNTAVILAFTLTAWATFILCHHLTRRFWPALIGGYLFGFSGFMIAQGLGHLHLIMLFPLPIAVYLAALRYENRLSRGWFLGLLALTVSFLFLVSVEEFTLMAIFAYLALGLWFFFHQRQGEPRQTLRLAAETTIAYLIAAVIVSPYLIYMALGYSKGVTHPVWVYSSDLLGPIIPTDAFWTLSKFFHNVPLEGGNLSEKDSYLGFPLALLMVVFAVKRWDSAVGKVLTILAAISLAFAFGNYLFVASVPTIPDPFIAVAFKLPIIQKSLPIRYALFLELIGAIMAALWLAQSVKGRATKYALGLALVVMLIPNTQPGIYSTNVDMPAFFSTSLYQRYIRPGDNEMILPVGAFRRDLLWQQQTNFAFNLVMGYGQGVPRPLAGAPIVPLFTTYEVAPNIPQQTSAAAANAYTYYMEQYIASEHVNGVVVGERYNAQVAPYLQFLHETPVHAGGVWYYPVSPLYSQATIPGEQVAGERAARPYQLDAAASWDEMTQQINVPAKTAGPAVETFSDSFPGGTYHLTLAIQSASPAPVASVEISVNGQVTVVPLLSGVTHTTLSIPGKSGVVVIRIISAGAASFTAGEATLAKV